MTARRRSRTAWWRYAGEPWTGNGRGLRRPRLIATAPLGASAGGHRERILELAALLESASDSCSSIDDLDMWCEPSPRGRPRPLWQSRDLLAARPPDYVLVAVAQEMID